MPFCKPPHGGRFAQEETDEIGEPELVPSADGEIEQPDEKRGRQTQCSERDADRRQLRQRSPRAVLPPQRPKPEENALWHDGVLHLQRQTADHHCKERTLQGLRVARIADQQCHP